jgi:glutathione S-transferase
MTVKLYGYVSGFSKIPAIVMREKGVDFDFVYMDIFGKKEQKTPEHIAKHPFGKVPVFVSTSSISSCSGPC